MLPFLRKISLEQFPFILITFIGTILFSYNIFNSPLTTDELSAIYRSNYNSLSDVFKYSIVKDVHPPLTQVFLYFWLKVSNTNIFFIKLPFLLMGIASIFLIFRLANNWFNKNVALLSTAFFVSIQFVIMYSQIARPYISGLFLCLIVALQWTKMIENKAKTLHYILYLAFGILSAYNHYFGTLQIAIIGLMGIFFIQKKQLLKYITVNFLIGLCFLPFITIMIQQMNYDGIDYLTKPSLNYILDYIYYIFQYSLLSVLFTISIVVYSIVKTQKIVNKKYTLITFSCFVLPIIIGLSYSISVRPVMPFRSLLFSLPFLIIFIFSFSQKIKPVLTIIFCGIMLTINIFTLITKRNHYTIFEKGIAKIAVSKTTELIKEEENHYVVFNTPDFDIQFYQRQFNSNFDYSNIYDSIPLPKEFRETLKKHGNENIIVFNLPLNLLSIVKEYYPNQRYLDYGFNYNFYCFSKTKNQKEITLIIDTTMSFEKTNDQNHPNNIVLDSNLTNHYYHFNKGEEWGPLLSIPIGKLISNNYCIVESKIEVLNHNKEHNGLLVFEIVNAENSIAWRSSDTKDWIKPSNNWQDMYFSVQLNELIKKNQLNNNLKLNVYFWNQDKKAISIDNISIKISEGNHLIYSLLEDFPN